MSRATALIRFDELLNTDGFVGKLILKPSTQRVFVAGAEVEIEVGDPTTLKIEDVLVADPRISPYGTFDLLTSDASGAINVEEGLFIHQIEDMLVSECDPECADCAAFARKEA